MTYDSNWRVISIKRVTNATVTPHTGPTWTFNYAPTGTSCPAGRKATKITDPGGKSTVYCYDEQLRVTDVFDAKGNQQTGIYDDNSNIKQINTPGTTAPYLFHFKSDGTNNPDSTTDPTGGTTAAAYGYSNLPYLPSQTTDQEGNSYDYGYDAIGNLQTVANGTSPTQIQATLSYTAFGAVQTASDGNGTWTYGYDPTSKNLTTVTPPSLSGSNLPASSDPLGVATLSYDAYNRVWKVWDGLHPSPGTPARIFTYDGEDRVKEVDYADGTWIKYTYDSNGNLTTRAEGSGSTTTATSSYTVDKLNRVTQDSLPGSVTNQYGYDDSSNLTSFTDAGGTVNYTYDDDDMLSKLAEPGGSCTGTTSLCTMFGYNARNDRTTTSYPNGVTITTGWDDDDKPSSIVSKKGTTVLQSFNYTYIDNSLSSRPTQLVQTSIDKDSNKTVYNYENGDAGPIHGPARLHDANDEGCRGRARRRLSLFLRQVRQSHAAGQDDWRRVSDTHLLQI
jgi:YD repeat-containing protein